jgi:hypothetical protein
MPKSTQTNPEPLLALDLPDPDAARVMAEKMANKIGKTVVVTDKDGHEVCRAEPRQH